MSEVQTLARGLRILEYLADAEEGLTSSELSELLGVDKASMSRLMATLTKYRFAERDEATRRYFLGTHIKELGRKAGQYASLRELSQPYLQNLASETRENAHLAVYSAPHVLTIADVPSSEALRVVSEVGRRLPLHCSAIGKCLLAFAEIPFPSHLTKYTDRTILDIETLKTHLHTIRQDGYVLDDEELTLGVRGLAAPVRNREGRMIAAMGLSGPSVRLTDEALPYLVELLKEKALRASQDFGFQLN